MKRQTVLLASSISAWLASLALPLAAQSRDDIKVVFERSDPAAIRAAAPRRMDPDRAAPAFRQVRINIDDAISDLRAVDLNKDGVTDIVILDKTNKRVRVYLGDRALSFSRTYKYGFSTAGDRILAVADFDKSGKPDVAVESTTSTRPASIFFGKGNGQLLGAPLHLTSSASVFAGLWYGGTTDLDGNGLPDILAQDFARKLFSFRNLGGKRFKAAHFDPGVGVGFAPGDFDGDKKGDAFIFDSSGRKVYFFKGLGDGTFLKQKGYTAEDSFMTCDLYAADFNNDKKLDLLGQGKGFGGTGNNWVYLGRGNGQLANRKFLPGQGSLRYGAAVANLDGDAKVDLAAAEDGGVWFYKGKGNGSFSPAVVLGEGLDFGFLSYGAQSIGAGDFNKDGKPDIVGAANLGGFYSLLAYLNGQTPATLAISNLVKTKLEHTKDRILFAGSLDYAGTGCVFKFLAAANDPRKSAHLVFKVQVDLPVSDVYITYIVSGEFLNGLNPDAGTVPFDLDLPSAVTILAGSYPSVYLLDLRLRDFNLVTSNTL